MALKEKSRALHRADIDGLRALAVIPVVAYYVGISVVPGGFVGVDVFFVISGYLITQVLLKDMERDQFSLANFYERRVRRLAPALIGVLVVVSLVCYRYSLPIGFLDYARSLIAATLSASNFYFWGTTNYFSAPAMTKPLLHTWSLAVEEQFYLIWPLLLLVGCRSLGKRMLLTTAIAAALSFALSAVGAFTYTTATFFLIPTRAWELLLGAILALGLFPDALRPAMRNAFAGAGVLLIVGSVFLIRNYMPFPGLLAAPACLGAFLVILAGRDGSSVAGELLSWRPVAYLGLISYSLYLWHWPLAVFQRSFGLLLIPGGASHDQKLLIIGCSLIVGALSYHFIEQPFSRAISPKRRLSRRAQSSAASASSQRRDSPRATPLCS